MVSPPRLLAFVLVLLALGTACDSEPQLQTQPRTQPKVIAPTPTLTPTPTPTRDSEEAAAKQQARALAKKLGGTLKARLQAAMREGGLERAVEVCAHQAQAMTAATQTHGARVGRSSLRLRNPKNAGPEWVRAWLLAQGERSAQGVVATERIEHGYARLIKPIAVEGICVTCHGPAAAIPSAVKQVLAARYPDDQATGYAPGDLRGALWAEVRVETETP